MVNIERDDESGRYTNTYSPEAFVDAVHDADGVAGTQDVADAVGCSYELAYKRLRALADAGDVESQKVANARVWIVTEDAETDDAQAAESGREAVTPATATADRTGPAPDAGGENAQTPPQDLEDSDLTRSTLDADPDARVRDAVADVSDGWQDTDSRLEDRREAARAVLAHVVETGDAVGKSDATERFLPEYAVGGQNAETWWRQNVRPVLQAVGEYENGRHGYTVDDLAGEP